MGINNVVNAIFTLANPDYSLPGTPSVYAVADVLQSKGIDPGTATQAQILNTYYGILSDVAQNNGDAALAASYQNMALYQATQAPAAPTPPSTSPPTAPASTSSPTAPASTRPPTAPASTSSPTAPASTSPPGSTPSTSGSGSTKPGSPKSGGAHALDELIGYCDMYPDDPSCLGGGVFGGNSGTTIINTTITGGTTTIVEQGLNAQQVDDTVNSALRSLWNITVGAIDAIVAAVIGELQGAITALGNAIVTAWQQLSRLSGFMLNLLKTLLDDILKGLLAALQDVGKLLKDVYDNVLKPIAAAAKALRDDLLGIYKRFIRPALIVIQDIRKVLAILRLFHIGFAGKLDAWLADLEGRITKPLYWLLGYVNQVANWINLIMTVDYLIQRPIWLNSLAAYKGSTTNLLLNNMNPPPNADDVAALQAAGNVPSTAQTTQALTAFLSTGGGDFAASIATQQAALLAQLAGSSPASPVPTSTST